MAAQRTSRELEAPFEITAWDETVYEEPAEGPKLTRITIRKRYHGAIEGSGVVEVLTAQGSAGAGYVASERIEGTLDGRRGTFVVQHSGLAEGTDQSSCGSVVPASGTGELADISGHAKEVQQEVLTLVCAL
ncbi:hypothetical protein FHR84_002071 [Actinopolyspora biskrensis]|uniref:DUF3224 domain-containing protein n=1 Tax=Actinopolyspora biskrensis TaxID=1470178 RepID=A0A852Z593_9ACTN|nr:DUF3224 domain-containing protein [Actinopolyspora biskrensis]NYH78746.1 hypothetical protein [Actinopolyspora biskrensis]